jgi:hypothetical protein
VGGVPGHGGGGHCGQAGGEHGGAVAGDTGRASADGLGHGGQQGGAHRGADLAAGVDHAADQALVGVGHAAAGQHHRPERGARGAEADQHDDQQDRAVADGGQVGEHREADRGHGAGQDQQPLDADAVGQARPEHARGEADHALRGDGQPGEQGRLMQDLLQVQRHDEHLAAVPQAQQERQSAAVAQARTAQQGQPDERLGVPGFGHSERGGGGGRGDDGGDDQRGGPAEDDALGHGEHEEGDGAGDQQGAAEVQAVRVAFCFCCLRRLAEDGGREGGGEQADGDVDQEHRAPAGELHEHAAENLAGNEPHGGDRTVQADGAGAFGSFGEAGGDEGQRGGGDDRGARALDDPGRDEQRGVLGQAAGQAGQAERDEADDEHAAPAEQVSRPAAENEQAAERDGVPRDDPLHGVRWHVQLALDRGQRDVHDAEVEDDHERRDQDEG